MQDRKDAGELSMGSIVVTIFLLIALALFSYKAWNRWQGQQSAPSEHPRQTGAAPAATEATPVGARAATVRRAPIDTSRALIKCVVNGVTSYTDGNCPTQATRSTVVVDPDTNLADGLQVSPAAVIRSPSPQVNRPQSDATAVANPDGSRKSMCDQYDEEIKRIDERARQPLSGQEQDWLAAKRKRARDEQFRLKC